MNIDSENYAIAVEKLVRLASSDTGGSRAAAQVVLSAYNGGEWQLDITEEIAKVDYAFLDATFYDGNELPGRDMSQIPHPFVVESMDLLKGLSVEQKTKVHFIHFNHTNPLLNEKSKEYKATLESGFQIAEEGKIYQ